MLTFKLPRVYPIVDVGTLTARGVALEAFVRGLVEGGAEILQLRDKAGAPVEVLERAGVISAIVAGTGCLPVMNDRADLAVLAGWNAVHVGHRDLPVEAVRRVFGAGLAGGRGEEELSRVWVGVSTHNEEQVRVAEAGEADYVAIGPVFATGTKADAEPTVGLAGVLRARSLTRKPLVAIGGITRENAVQVIEAGADGVAVIGGLLSEDESPASVMEDFRRRLR